MMAHCAVCSDRLGKLSNRWVYNPTNAERVCSTCYAWANKWIKFFNHRNFLRLLFP